jgi:hypothetical protein
MIYSVLMLLSGEAGSEGDSKTVAVLYIVDFLLMASCLVLCLAELALTSAACLVCPAPHAVLENDQFWHVQLAHPIRFADVQALIVSPDSSATFVLSRPVRLRFLSPWNVRRVTGWNMAAFRFSLVPSPFLPREGLITLLIDAVERHGGEVRRSWA